ncbi:type IV secretory pathway VirJ component [Rhodopseudomonas julia]|uniref:Type IV secretory pathway VirJ component n=1 Tax=Rhodopseudomonas julia TaxID=200617 RepID=A0ABU0C146_9BRAD|nr:AcvB/VirJ family lysyl-phosphatidylglycerol hydrolase [Rhodopseudomonas julia]MDQ0324243.1 type IV secretory pathway VirJ component [Rhodopseudomonas julia]
MKHLFCAVLAVLCGSASFDASAAILDSGQPAIARILNGGAPVSGIVFLISDRDGWSDEDDASARSLAEHRAIVVGVDLPRYLAALDAEDGDCAYLVSDIEALSHKLQRQAGTSDYHAPIIAGEGAGGGLAIAIAAQTPEATVGHTLALDPTPGISLRKPLCSGAPRQNLAGETIYGLSPGPLPDPVDVYFSPTATQASKAHIADLVSEHFAVSVTDGEGAEAGFEGKLDALLKLTSREQEGAADMPIVELAATPAVDAMAIVYSGDGGWRDLDRTIAGIFQAKGLPTIGVDSLRYFWSEKTPEEVAHDLAGLIDAYTAKWAVGHVALVGYSFGADMMPEVYNALDAPHQAKVAQISLLAVAPSAEFEITVSGWLGVASASSHPTLPQIERIDPAKLQCVYGADDSRATVCPALADSHIEIIETTGGHHFDGDYDALAATILSGLKSRLKDK